MLDYAARRLSVAKRGSSPNALLMIVAAHVAALAALMSAKMELPLQIDEAPIKIDLLRAPNPPPPNPPTSPTGPRMPTETAMTRTPPIVPTPMTASESVDTSPRLPTLGPAVVPAPVPTTGSVPHAAPPAAAQLLTPPAELKPPYP